MADAAVSIPAKNPVKQRAGQLGARSRWGDPGVINLSELTPPQRRLVIALVDAARREVERDPTPEPA